MSLRNLILVLLAATFVASCVSPAAEEELASHKSLAPGEVTGPLPAGYDAAPRLISGKAPIYPISQLLKGSSGHSIIQFTIDADGTTKDFLVLETDYRYYADHAILTAQNWHFEPARKNGKPVAVRVRQEFKYVIQ